MVVEMKMLRNFVLMRVMSDDEKERKEGYYGYNVCHFSTRALYDYVGWDYTKMLCSLVFV
jgi:hypothetical protein